MITRRCLLRAASLAPLTSLAPFGRAQAQERPLILVGSDGWLYPGWEWTSGLDPAAVELTTGLVGYAGELLAGRGVTLLIFVVPARARLEPGHLPTGIGIDDSFREHYRMIVDRLPAGSVAFDTLDLLQGFQARRMQILHKTDQHWTLYASEAAARHVADVLQTAFDLPSSQARGARLGRVRIETRPGDFLGLLPTERRALYPPEDFRLRESSAPGGLLDAPPPANVAVLGDSAVKPELGFTATLSAWLQRPVQLFWRQGNIGPWVTLLEYAASDQFRSGAPKYLIWELHENYFASPPDRAGWWDEASLMTAAEWRTRLRAALP